MVRSGNLKYWTAVPVTVGIYHKHWLVIKAVHLEPCISEIIHLIRHLDLILSSGPHPGIKETKSGSQFLCFYSK